VTTRPNRAVSMYLSSQTIIRTIARLPVRAEEAANGDAAEATKSI
jgi:hypothetical protein